ncbi:MAG: prepilin peptidase [Candidatus Vogelbacteria bacterium]|nr:prepilin peptidase [Candidatus Vogelbacteria bacterium]
MFTYFITGSLGLIIGSFLNVILFRYGTGQGLGGRSQCQNCGKMLSWLELVPVVSFIIQKRRCRGCASTISWQYPAVELLTSLCFIGFTHAVLYLNIFKYNLTSGWGIALLLTLIVYLVCASVLVLIAVYDLHHKIIPDEWVFILTGLGALLPLVSGQGFGYIVFALLNKSLAALVLAGFFWFIWYFSKGKAMGFGDVKLAVALGFFLGLDQGIIAVVLAFWIGAVVGLSLIAVSKYKPALAVPSINKLKSQIPFAPFLVLGTILALVFDLHFLTMFF